MKIIKLIDDLRSGVVVPEDVKFELRGCQVV